VTIKIAYLECHNWTIITHITSFLTIFGWFLYQTIYSYLYPNSFKNAPYEVKGVFQKVSMRTEFWVTILITISLAIIPNLILKVLKSIILPTDVDIYQEVERDDELLEKLINRNKYKDDKFLNADAIVTDKSNNNNNNNDVEGENEMKNDNSNKC